VIIQLDPLIKVKTPLGEGYAIFLEANEQDYWYTVALGNGALVAFSQDRIRISNSYTHRRGISDERMQEIVDGV